MKCRFNASISTIFCIVFVATTNHVVAEVFFFTDENQWLEQVVGVETLTTDASSISLADEVDMPPAVNASVSNILTFGSSSTGLSRGFTLSAQEPGADFVFSDTNVANEILPTYANALSVGRVDGFENDDWRVVFANGPATTAFAFDLRDNQVNIGGIDRLRILATDGSVLGETTSIPASPTTGGSFFLGLISDRPFAAVDFDEDGNPDDIAIANLRFASFTGVISTIEGDYNGDGFVSQADLDLVLLNWGEAVLPQGWLASTQFDGGLVSQNELDGVLLNWGNGSPPAPGTVIPEPASLLGWTFLPWSMSRRRRTG